MVKGPSIYDVLGHEGHCASCF